METQASFLDSGSMIVDLPISTDKHVQNRKGLYPALNIQIKFRSDYSNVKKQHFHLKAEQFRIPSTFFNF